MYGSHAVLVAPRQRFAHRPSRLLLSRYGPKKDFVPGGAIPPANQTGGALAEDAGRIAIAVQLLAVFILCHINVSSYAQKTAGKPAA